jgi:hypothetical protein
MIVTPVIFHTGSQFWGLLLQVFERALGCGFQTPIEVSIQIMMIIKEEASQNQLCASCP